MNSLSMKRLLPAREQDQLIKLMNMSRMYASDTSVPRAVQKLLKNNDCAIEALMFRLLDAEKKLKFLDRECSRLERKISTERRRLFS